MCSIRCSSQWTLFEPSINMTLGSVTGYPEMGACRCIRLNFTEECAMLRRVQEVRCCCYIWHDGACIAYISLIERREFALLLKVLFHVGHEHISQKGTKRGSHGHTICLLAQSTNELEQLFFVSYTEKISFGEVLVV